MDKLVLPSQRAEVFHEIQRAGLNPHDFSWREAISPSNKANTVSMLVHDRKPYWFVFDVNLEKHGCVFAPGRATPTETRSPGLWVNQIVFVRQWLQNVKREVETPDPWAGVAAGAALARAAGDAPDSNAPLSTEEQQRLAAGLREIQEQLKALHSLTAAEIAFVEARFAYLEEAGTRLGRKDWVGIFIGTMTSIIVQVALPPETTREIFRTAANVLSWLLGGSPLLPP